MNLRQRVSKEAAFFLYRGVAEEYKQAKEMAAKNVGIKSLPSNIEVAIELDKIADEIEGEKRKKRISEMRHTALKLMENLRIFYPKLIGSVWRGTAHHNSDIDIVVYSSSKEEIIEKLKKVGTPIEREKTSSFIKSGTLMISNHLYLQTPLGYKVEIIVRPPWEEREVELCEIYGDLKVGLKINQLKKIIKEDPLRKFIPIRRR
jgi:predicted nucleotidyltransferase